MTIPRLALIALTALLAVACSREQPSAMPAAQAPPPPPAQAPPPPLPPPAVATAGPAIAVDAAPPPLDEQLAEFEKTGFPACDDYFEKARQCINTRLSPDDRLVAGKELKDSARIMLGNVKLDQQPERIEKTCKRLRAATLRKLSGKGCTAI